MQRLAIQLPFISLMLIQGLSSAQDVHFTVVKNATEILSPQILGMTQDAQGFLWLSTQQGLFRYDGNTYISYHHEPLSENSPAQEVIECLTADSTYIWSAPQWLGLDRLDPVSGSFQHYRHDRNNPNSLANDSVMALLTDREGTLWIGTYQGLDRLDKGSTTFVHYRHDSNDPSSLSFNAVRSLYEDKLGTIWVGTGSVFNQGDPRFKNAGGLNKLNRATGKFTRYLHDERDSRTLTDNRIRAIFEDSRGTFWVGTAGDGLHTLNRETGIFKRHRFDPSHPEKLSRPPLKSSLPWGEDHISFIAEEHSGKIVIGTFSAGIHVYDPATQKVMWYGTDKKCNKQLADELFWTAYKTTDNTLWISAWGGNLYKAAPAQSPISYTRTGRVTIALVEDDRQNLWIGTASGLFCKDKHGNEERYLIDPDHPASPANLAFPIDRDHDKLLIQTSFGLYFFDVIRKQFSRFLHHDPRNENSLPSDTIPRVRKTAEGNLWIATYRGLASWNAKSGTIKRYLNDPRDSTTIVNDGLAWIEIDRKNNLWVGTAGGLCRLEKNTNGFKRYPDIRGVLHILEDSNGNLWVGGQDGLFQYDAHQDTFHKFKDGFFIMPAQVQVGWMMEDAHKNIWMGTSAGIIELRADDNLRPVALGKNFGVKPLALTSGHIRHNGSVLFADTSGYFEINPALLRESNHRVAITNLLFDNEPVIPGTTSLLPNVLPRTKEIKLGYDQNTFAFEFTSIDFSCEQEPPQLFYRLENYEKTWRKAGSEKTAYYFGIPAGNYVFKIKAIDVKGNAVEKSMIVIIGRPWWKTWWAYSLAAITIGSMTYVVYNSRVRQLKKQQAAQISIMVATQEQERKRISRDLHDDVGTKLSALKMFISSLREKAVVVNEKEIASLAESSEQFIKEAISDVRNLLLNLSPSVLDEFGFVTAVEVLVSKLNETRQVHFALVVFGMECRVQQEYELALYRITQELINNVLKHAEAKHVSLQIGRRNDKIILMIEDDGKGFDMNISRNGYGLQNIAARAELMHGIMTTDSKPGKGTSISIEIPYELNPS